MGEKKTIQFTQSSEWDEYVREDNSLRAMKSIMFISLDCPFFPYPSFRGHKLNLTIIAVDWRSDDGFYLSVCFWAAVFFSCFFPVK